MNFFGSTVFLIPFFSLSQSEFLIGKAYNVDFSFLHRKVFHKDRNLFPNCFRVTIRTDSIRLTLDSLQLNSVKSPILLNRKMNNAEH